MSVWVFFKCIEARVIPAIRFETCALERRERSRRCSLSAKHKHSEIRENLGLNGKLRVAIYRKFTRRTSRTLKYCPVAAHSTRALLSPRRRRRCQQRRNAVAAFLSAAGSARRCGHLKGREVYIESINKN